MNGVKVKERENIEGAIRRFKRTCEKTITEVKGRRVYEKPSDARKRKVNALKRQRFREVILEKKYGTHYKKPKK